MVEEKIEEKNYTSKELNDQYRHGYQEGYQAGFRDGKEAHNKPEEGGVRMEDIYLCPNCLEPVKHFPENKVYKCMNKSCVWNDVAEIPEEEAHDGQIPTKKLLQTTRKVND